MRSPLVVIFVLITVLAVSCRGRRELGDVRGAVTLDGRPLAGATVIFEPASGGHSSKGITDEAGRYRLIYLRDIEGALIGRTRVKISTASEDNPKELVPGRYNKKTALAAEVKNGSNECDFQLNSR